MNERFANLLIAYFLWRLASLLASVVPLRPSYACASAVADLVFAGWREKRENAIDNIHHVFPEADEATTRRVARQSFRNYGKYLVDFIRAQKIRPQELEGKFEVEEAQWQLIEQAQAEGKGTIIAAMHFGVWDMGAALLTQRGYVINVVAERVGHNKLNQMIIASRVRQGMRVIELGRSPASIVRALRRNEILAILIDRPETENGVAIRFFGRRAVVPTGPARLALRTGAPVLPVALVRLNGVSDRVRVLIEPNLNVQRTGDEGRDVCALTEAIFMAHARVIRRFPDQWYMFRRMWEAEP